jgi:hypothetical protein
MNTKAVFALLVIAVVIGVATASVVSVAQQAQARGATGCHTASGNVLTPSGRTSNHFNTGCFGSSP